MTADNLQKIYASDTQTVTALLVQEGQTVKKGDPLFRYDTTLSDIQVERQEIAVKQDDLNLNKAKKDLGQHQPPASLCADAADGSPHGADGAGAYG